MDDGLKRLWQLRDLIRAGERVKPERDEMILAYLRRGRSQRWVAEQAGVSRTYVQWLVSGRPDRRRGGQGLAA